MKKTLSLLLAAAAASAVYAQDSTEEVLFTQSWTDQGPAADNTTHGGNFLYTKGNAYATIGTVGGTLYNPWFNASEYTGNSFSLSFELKNGSVSGTTSAWDNILTIKMTDGTMLSLQSNESGQLNLFSTSENSACGLLNVKLSDFTNWGKLEIVGSVASGNISVYYTDMTQEGASATLVGSSPENKPWTGSTITGFQFAGTFAAQDDNRKLAGSMDINNIELTVSSQVTPEPTTATLSLLALAGLCARRRRK